MEKIITLSDCLKKEEHIWKRKITTGFLIVDPRVLELDNISAKYQLFHVIADISNGELVYKPYVAERCIDGELVYLNKTSVIGEPTFETLLEWVSLYGKESAYNITMDDYHRNHLLAVKNNKDIKEEFYEVAFVWND